MRRKKAYVDPVSISPNSVLTKDVLTIVVDEIIRGTLDVISVLKPQGDPVNIFFDSVVFLADFKECARSDDTMSQPKRPQCTLTANTSTEVMNLVKGALSAIVRFGKVGLLAKSK